MKASVLIPTYGNRLQYLRDALTSLQQQDYPAPDFEIIVIDNGPFPEVLEIVKEFDSNGKHLVRYIKEPKPGLLEGRHAGAREARGDILVYLDDDVILHPDWLKYSVEPYQDPKVGGAGGKVVLQIEGEKPVWLAHFGSVCHSELDLGPATKELKWPDCVWGCNMSVRKSVFEEVGGFNPDLFGDRKLWWYIGDGECGFEKKIYDAGYKIVYEPKAWIYHRIPPSRLTEQYFYQRTYTSGLTASYTQVRDSKRDIFFVLRRLGRMVYGFFKAARKYLSGLIKPRWKVRSKASSLFWFAYAQHQLRTAFDKKLRDHIFRKSYL